MPPPSEKTVSVSLSSVVRVVAVVLACVIFFIIRDVILAVLLSVIVASSLEPVIRFLSSRRIPRTGAVLFVYAFLIICIGLFFYLVVPLVLSETVSLMKTLPEFIHTLDTKSPVFASISGALQNVSASDSLGEYVTSIAATLGMLGSGSVQIGSYLFGGAAFLILVFVLSFYLSAQQDGVGDFLRIITPLEHEPYIIGLWRRAQRNISRWMQGQLVLGLMVGFFVYIGLSILGIRHALLLAIISALFEIIPVFGPILGAIPGIVIGFVDGGIGLSLLVAGLYVIIQQLESNVIYPLVVKKVIGVPPIVVILSLLIGFTLGGFIGVLLSVPVATVCIEYLHDRERSRRGIV